MGEFDPNRDMKVEATQGEGGIFVLRTNGLAARGLSELVLDGVPDGWARHGAVAINEIARYIANEKRVANGERLAITTPMGALVVRLEDGGGQGGFFSSLLGRGAGTQRIVEAVPGMAHPCTLLTTMALWRSNAALEDGDRAASRESLSRSIAYFPGDPARRSLMQWGFAYNWENHLSYALLATLAESDDERVDYLDAAFDRCEEHELRMLGDPRAELSELGDVREQVARIVAENVATARRQDIQPGLTMIASPTWGVDDSERDLRVRRALTIVPTLAADLYYSRASLARLEGDLIDLVAETFAMHSSRPARLATFTRDVIGTFEGDVGEAPAMDCVLDYRVGDRLLSLLLAESARCVAAEMTTDELRARFGLDGSRGDEDRARAKLEAFEERESAAIMSAMSGGN